MSWEIIYYESEDGKCPITDFINSRKETNQVKILNQIEILSNFGPQLPRPYADILVDGIHELRIKLSGDQVRFLYFFVHKDYIVLTHSFIKKTDKVPKKEIATAKKYRDDFTSRFKTKQAIEKETQK